MVRFGESEIAKEMFYAPKKQFGMLNVQNIVISKSVETKTDSKYLIEIKFDKSVRPLVLIMPKMSGYVKIFKVKGDKDKNNKLISFRIDDEKLLKKYKDIWTKIKNLKMLN